MNDSFEGKKVLIVDDEAVIIRAIERTLKPEFVTDGVVSVKDARSKIEEVTYDVIISDMMIGEELGTDLYKYLKEFHPEQLKNLLLMSGGVHGKDAPALQEYVDHMDERGRFIKKPFAGGEKLRKKVFSVLRGELEAPSA